ncbi:MAG TPA: Uma2 family endonuclease [Rugosimonospora sp.]|nr:Uma2 family endonuclease [Rugosimonospora sp.]
MAEVATVEKRPFTRADLARLPDDGRRYEIIDGDLYMSGAPSARHQRAVGRLYRLLDDACPEGFEVVLGPFEVGLANDTEMRPDLLVARREDLTDKEITRPPALVVEVLSPSTRSADLNAKRWRLERAGTPSYWAVDPGTRPEQARLIVWELAGDGRYRQVADVTGDAAWQVSRPYPVVVVPAALAR